jgi:hypothetical protein
MNRGSINDHTWEQGHGGFFGTNWRKLKILKMNNAIRLSLTRRVKRGISYTQRLQNHMVE